MARAGGHACMAAAQETSDDDWAMAQLLAESGSKDELGSDIEPEESPACDEELGGAGRASASEAGAEDGAEDGAEKDDEDGDDMFSDLWGAETVDEGTPRKAPSTLSERDCGRSEGERSDADQPMECSLCGMRSTDMPVAGGECLVNFGRRLGYNGEAACDNCFGMLKAQGSRSIRSMADSLGKDTGAKLDYLETLSIWLALKSTSDRQRVHPTILDRMGKVVRTAGRLREILLEANGLATVKAPSTQIVEKTLVSGMRAFDLRTYIAQHGNPMINGDSVLQGVAGDKVQLIVVSAKACDTGRHSLSSAVATCGNGLQGDVKKQLGDFSLDDMEDIPLVKHILEEYACRTNLKKQLAARGPLRPRSEGARSGDAAGGAAPLASARATPSKCQRAAAASIETSTTPQKASKAESCGAASSSSGVARAGSTTKQSLAMAVGIAEQPSDKDLAKLTKKVAVVVGLFTDTKWVGQVKGKEKSWKRLLVAIDDKVEHSLANQNEHLLDDLKQLKEVTESALHLMVTAKKRKFDPTELCERLMVMKSFLMSSSEGDGPTMALDPSLEKLLVPRGVGGR